MHTRTDGKKNIWKEYCTGKVIIDRFYITFIIDNLQVISDVRDLNEAYQYFKKKYKDKWKKKKDLLGEIEDDNEDKSSDKLTNI